MLGKFVGISLATSLLCLLAGASVFAQVKSPVVSLDVPDTTLTVQGYAAPGALVIIEEGGSNIGTVLADSSGYFTTILVSQPFGVRDLQLHYDDGESLLSSIITESISVQPQQNTTLDVFLSPTIARRTQEKVQKGSIVQISGRSTPGATIKLVLSATGPFYTTTVDATGFYEFLVDSTDLDEAMYSASVVATISGSLESSTSNMVVFVITAVDAVDDEEVPVVFIVGPDELAPPVPLTPDDGTVIDGDSVTVEGESIPNAQINIYENGQLYGSVFADSSGKWSFEYTATSSPVTLTFESCIDGVCSVLSKSITLSFTKLQQCSVNFELAKYRFWGIRTDEQISLVLVDDVDSGIVEINWGDGASEKFDFRATEARSFEKSYESKGSYNGTITYSANDNESCEITRYFSVQVINKESSAMKFLWLVLVVVAGLLIMDLARKKKRL